MEYFKNNWKAILSWFTVPIIFGVIYLLAILPREIAGWLYAALICTFLIEGFMGKINKHIAYFVGLLVGALCSWIVIQYKKTSLEEVSYVFNLIS